MRLPEGAVVGTSSLRRQALIAALPASGDQAAAW
jgi:porphobilinogen deaminase